MKLTSSDDEFIENLRAAIRYVQKDYDSPSSRSALERNSISSESRWERRNGAYLYRVPRSGLDSIYPGIEIAIRLYSNAICPRCHKPFSHPLCIPDDTGENERRVSFAKDPNTVVDAPVWSEVQLPP